MLQKTWQSKHSHGCAVDEGKYIMQINRNMSAVIANNQLLGIEDRLSASIERLSSGLKINRASDNPAGMAISNKMKAQIDALDQAEANAADGISVVQIADGALNEVSSILQRIRELSVQAANGVNSFNDRQSMQDEVAELVKEVDRISADTEYNTKKLLGFYRISEEVFKPILYWISPKNNEAYFTVISDEMTYRYILKRK